MSAETVSAERLRLYLEARQEIAALRSRVEELEGALREAEQTLQWASGAFDSPGLAEAWALRGRPVLEKLRAFQPDKGERCGGTGRKVRRESVLPCPTEPCPGCPDCREESNK